MEFREYTTYQEEEILALYASVGWTSYTNEPELLRKGFENSLYIFAAYDQNELIGLVRTVGDGCTIVFVQDLLVNPKHHRKGVGTRLLKHVLQRYSNVRQIELITDDTPETLAFYRANGFDEMFAFGCRAFMRLP